MRRAALLAALIVGVLFLFQGAEAIGITSTDINAKFTYVPGQTIVHSYRIIPVDKVASYDISIDQADFLSPHAKLDVSEVKNLPAGEFADFKVTVSLPNEVPEPGPSMLTIRVTEKQSDIDAGGGIGAFALASTAAHMTFKVYYPGKYAMAKLKIIEGNVNQIIPFIVKVENWGTEDLSSVKAEIKITTQDGVYVDTIHTNEISIPYTATEELNAQWDPSEVEPGMYLAKAIVTYDGQTTETKERGLTLGEGSVDLVSYTQELKPDQINQFDIIVKSDWIGKLEDVYAEVFLNGQTYTTQTVSLTTFEERSLSTFIDTTGMQPGGQNGKIVIHFGKDSTEHSIALIILQPDKLTAAQVAEPPTKKGYSFDTFTVVIIAILVAVMFSVVFMMNRMMSMQNKMLQNQKPDWPPQFRQDQQNLNNPNNRSEGNE